MKHFKRRHVSGSSPTPKSPTKKSDTRLYSQVAAACVACKAGHCNDHFVSKLDQRRPSRVTPESTLPISHHPASTQSPKSSLEEQWYRARELELENRMESLLDSGNDTPQRHLHNKQAVIHPSMDQLIPTAHDEDCAVRQPAPPTVGSRYATPDKDPKSGRKLVRKSPLTLARQTSNFMLKQHKRQDAEHARFVNEMQRISMVQYRRIEDLAQEVNENEALIRDLGQTVLWQSSRISKLECALRQDGKDPDSIHSSIEPIEAPSKPHDDPPLSPIWMPATPSLRPQRLDPLELPEHLSIDQTSKPKVLPLRPKHASCLTDSIDTAVAQIIYQGQIESAASDDRDLQSAWNWFASDNATRENSFDLHFDSDPSREGCHAQLRDNKVPVQTPESTRDSIQAFSSESEYVYQASNNPYSALLNMPSPLVTEYFMSSPATREKMADQAPVLDRDGPRTVPYLTLTSTSAKHQIDEENRSVKERLVDKDCRDLLWQGTSSMDRVKIVSGRTARLFVDELGWARRVD